MPKNASHIFERTVPEERFLEGALRLSLFESKYGKVRHGFLNALLAIKIVRIDHLGDRLEQIGVVFSYEHRRASRAARRHDTHLLMRFKAVHLDENLIERLFALVVAATDTGAAHAPDRVDFINENNRGRGFFRHLKQIPNA